jgi:hypothetical protein
MLLAAAGTLALLFSASLPEDKLAEGRQLLHNLDEQGAIAALEEGLAAHPDPPIRAQLAVYLGLARFNLLDSAGARAAFRQALLADPAVALPPTASPRAAVLFNEERSLTLATAPPPTVHTSSEKTSSAQGGTWRKPTAWVLGGASLVAAVGAVGFGIGSRSARSHADTAATANAARGDYDLAKSRATMANILFISAGALAAGSVALMFWPTPGGGQAQLSLAF